LAIAVEATRKNCPHWHRSFLAPTVLCVLESRSFNDSSSCLMSIPASSRYFSSYLYCFLAIAVEAALSKRACHHLYRSTRTEHPLETPTLWQLLPIDSL
jgi:hypothetical protein